MESNSLGHVFGPGVRMGSKDARLVSCVPSAALFSRARLQAKSHELRDVQRVLADQHHHPIEATVPGEIHHRLKILPTLAMSWDRGLADFQETLALLNEAYGGGKWRQKGETARQTFLDHYQECEADTRDPRVLAFTRFYIVMVDWHDLWYALFQVDGGLNVYTVCSEATRMIERLEYLLENLDAIMHAEIQYRSEVFFLAEDARVLGNMQTQHRAAHQEAANRKHRNVP
jgi:hypothetical protein